MPLPWERRPRFALEKGDALNPNKKPLAGEWFPRNRFRAQALNVFNLTNFLLFVPGSGITPTMTINSGFGQTTGAYRDLSNTNDPGGRILEFVLRLNF